MNSSTIITKYFDAISRRDIAGIRSCICHDATLKFGDFKMSGVETIIQGYQMFFKSIQAYSLEIIHIWECNETVIIVEGETVGRNAAGNSFTVPFASVFELKNNRISHQRDYFDPGKMLQKN